MKRLLLLVLLFLTASSVYAQDPVSARFLQGSWKLTFEIDKHGDSALERIALNAVDGFLDELDIRMDFERNGDLRISVTAFNEVESEEGSWEINDEGALFLDDTDSVDLDEDSFWMREGSRLVPYKYDRHGELERSDAVYLERVRQ